MNQVIENMNPLFSQLNLKGFQRMIAISVLLHLAVFVCMVGGRRTEMGGRRVAMLDLTMSAPSLPRAVPDRPHAQAPTPQVEAPPAVPATPAQPPSELENLQKNIESSTSAESEAVDVNKASVGLGITRGYFRSLGEGATLREDIQEYYFELLQTINERWWLDKNINRKGIRELVLNVIISRDGTIVAKELIRSSGDVNYDKAVLNALDGAGQLPPLPSSFTGDLFVAPIRLVAPLYLLAS